MHFLHYNEILNNILSPHGLAHGYVVFHEGPLSDHFIYKDMGTERYFFGLLSRPKRHMVAQIVTEPASVTFKVSYLEQGQFQIHVLDQEYAKLLADVAQEVQWALVSPPSTFVSESSQQVLRWI